ncbi:MAG: phage tail protein [Myxococcota bacterium]
MASTTISTSRVDPFLTYNFQVKWDNNYVAAVSKASGLSRTTDVVPFRSGGQPQSMYKIPGQTDYGALTLEQGVTFDTTFEQWANKVWYYPNTSKFGQEVSLKDFRKNLQLEMYNQAGQLVMRYNIYNCWPSEYTPLPELSAEANVVAFASLTLQNEGWSRDTSVTPPTLPSFNEPSN